ncbi:MAG: endolytic transglycosylase MltG [Proteobacteria bacterium]|nr:endolytic transglycosylase MltG [Pseudomonadota bacterium]MCL2306966.1 endolytic transglycosylase MltG [Pseudomonadota bacterium]
MKKAYVIRSLWVIAALALLGLALLAWVWRQPLPLPTQPYLLTVPKGATLNQVAATLARDGVLRHPWQLTVPARAQGQAAAIKAGRYRFEGEMTLTSLLQKLVDGITVPVVVTITEGSTFADLKRRLRDQPDIVNTVLDAPDAQILQAVGASETLPEGLFFPDTYHFAADSDDVTVLKTAYQALQTRLSESWAKRQEGLPLASPYEALILASIVEKETGTASDRPLVASVFINRLRIGMRLQADPTVIYGMGARYDGKLRRRDLDTDTPYNTYTRAGLPPTPIAMVSQASLDAVLQPPSTKYMYFVSRNDGSGSSEFSETLDQHNRAVARYILKRRF